MFLFGHIGITLGAALAITGVVVLGRKAASYREMQPQTGQVADSFPAAAVNRVGLTSLLESLGSFMDLRLLALCSILPDIIDKPLGMFLFGNGRIFAHSLVIALLVLVIGGFLWINYKRTAVLAVACGMAAHLILDQMWLNSSTFLWPLFGWTFPAAERSNYLATWLKDLVSVPEVYITELVGLFILALLAGTLIYKKKLFTTLRTGGPL